ncbi:MAG: redoxin domain-containing protein [Flavobacteriales bacterium]|nr:redoxin domain-containing protein [Flavobacteriales bacterium]
MLHRALPLLALALLSPSLMAQQGGPKRHIEIRIEGMAKGDTVYLANYYGSKLYYNDTTIVDGRMTATFNDEKGYAAGVYAVVVPGPKYFEMVVNEPVIKLSTRKDDLLPGLLVKQSKENELFIGYIRFLNDRKIEGDALRAQLDAAKEPGARDSLKKRMDELDQRVKQYQRDLVKDHAGTLASSLVKMSMAVELPEPRKADGSLDSAAAYYQYRDHFWDNFDLTDDRIVHVPVFGNKFEEYISKVVPQIPDTINRLADALIARTGDSKKVYQYMVHNITHKYETSDIMGMDAVFVHMALTYYCPKGQPTRVDWMSAGKIDTLCTRARKMAPLTIGRKAPYLALTDTTEERWINYYDLPQDFVVVIFWDPHCGHCKKELPEIHKVYKETLKPMGIEVYAVAKAVEEDLFTDWKKFIRENELDWVNVGLTWHVFADAKKDPRKFIPEHTTIESLNYADTWDVFSTPKIFLVDGDRKIAGKSLSAEQIADLVTKLRERKAKK